jgi:hypothetical protein
VDCREPSGAKMAARIADLVNETLAESRLDTKLDSSDILNLIDSGRSEGGSQARNLSKSLEDVLQFPHCKTIWSWIPSETLSV